MISWFYELKAILQTTNSATANTGYQNKGICYLIPSKMCNAITNYQITWNCSLTTNNATVINGITNYQVTQNCSLYLQTVQLPIKDTKIQGSVTRYLQKLVMPLQITKLQGTVPQLQTVVLS